MPFRAVWDGRVWDEEARAMEPAPEGDYAWVAVFTLYGGPDGDGARALELSFTVVVGAT